MNRIALSAQEIVEIKQEASPHLINKTIFGYAIGFNFKLNWSRFFDYNFKDGDFFHLHLSGADVYFGRNESDGIFPVSFCGNFRAENYITTVPINLFAIYKKFNDINNGNILTLWIPIDGQLFAKIENLRKGGDLVITVVFYGEVETKIANNTTLNINEPKTVRSDSVIFCIPQSDWVRALEMANISHIPILESPILRQEIIEIFKDAEKSFHNGNYRQCIAHCRQAYDLTEIDYDCCNYKKIFDIASKDKNKMTAMERFTLVFHAAKHITNLSHHLDENNSNYEYSRPEASMVLGITASILSLATSGYLEKKLQETQNET